MEQNKNYQTTQDITPRLFKSDFMEFFSHVHPTVPLILFIPAIVYLSYLGSIRQENTLTINIISLLLGLLFWTLFEYLLHRFLFHYSPHSEWGKKIFYVFHGVHHAFPSDSKRLVMPPALSIPLASILYFTSKSILPAFMFEFFSVGFIIGYLFYDMTHYMCHHFKLGFWPYKLLKAHHLKHHYKDPSKGYGVSSPLWDIIFRT